MPFFHPWTAGPISPKLCTDPYTSSGKVVITRMTLPTQPPDPGVPKAPRPLADHWRKIFALQKMSRRLPLYFLVKWALFLLPRSRDEGLIKMVPIIQNWLSNHVMPMKMGELTNGGFKIFQGLSPGPVVIS